MKPTSWMFMLAISTLFAAPLGAAPKVLDSGIFKIIDHDKPRGFETFSYHTTGDSLLVVSQVFETIPNEEADPDTFEKEMTLVVSSADYDLRNYESHQRFKGQMVKRGLVMDDTLFTSYIQIGDHGTGDRLVRPPGRMFVADPQIFTLYDVICRNLHGKTFDKRPLSMFVLGAPDSMMEVIATHLGSETIRWGTRSVPARKISINDGGPEYFLWISRQGQMIRLSQPEYGLLVERDPPAAKPPVRRTRNGG